eukprot:6196778-Pleurochrysis_carterae.AAC.1
MSDSVGPKGSGGATGNQVGACELHDASDRSFSDTVQLMDVWRACSGVYSLVGEEFSELLRQKFTGVVAMERTYNAGGSVATLVQ